MSNTYRNGFFGTVKYAEEFITAPSRPTEYRGHQIYRRFDRAFDVVFDGVCIHNRMTVKGCQLAIDDRLTSQPVAA